MGGDGSTSTGLWQVGGPSRRRMRRWSTRAAAASCLKASSWPARKPHLRCHVLRVSSCRCTFSFLGAGQSRVAASHWLSSAQIQRIGRDRNGSSTYYVTPTGSEALR